MTQSGLTQPDVAGMNEGDIVWLVATGQAPFERGSAAEPSLLPHIARLCHDFSIGEVLHAADLFGRGGHPHSWPQIRESVWNRLAVRFDDDEFRLQTQYLVVDPVELAVRRCIIGTDTASPELWERVDALGDLELRTDLSCRLLELEPIPDVRRYDRTADEIDVALASADAVRALTDVGFRLGRLDELHVLDDVTELATTDPGRSAHLLPSLPKARRGAVADELVRVITEMRPPAWSVALYASRLAPYTSSRASWDGIHLFEHPDDVWRRWIGYLLDAPAAPDRHADTLRAHPFAPTLDLVEGPHETTSGLANQIVGTYGGAPPVASAAPGEPVGASPPSTDQPEPPPPPSVAPAPTGEPLTVVDDRRLGVDLFAEGRHLTRAVVAGTPTDVEVSIGHGATVSLATPIDVPFEEGVDVRSLPVRFVVDDVIDVIETLRLRRDPAATATVTFRVTPIAPTLDAVIIVYNEDQSAVIQAAALSVSVVASFDEEASAAPSITLSTIPAAAFSVAGRPDSATVVTDGRTTVPAAPHLSLPASSHSAVGQIEEILTAIELGAANHLAADLPIDAALIGLARAGVRLRNDARLDELEPFERIQVVSVTGQTVFPLELVYGGSAPRDGATLCRKWKRSVAKGSCRSCGSTGSSSVVCPARFWGISKVIEHHCGETTGGTEYSARVQITDDLVALAAPDSTVVAASELVVGPSADADALKLLATAATKLGRVETARDWATWADLVSKRGPTVLVALPHQGSVDDHTITDAAALEIGGVFETTFEEFHLRRAGDAPGPLVLLIGCNTGVERHVIASFASRFRQWSPVVVATLGEVLVDEADLVAATVLAEVAKAAKKRSRTTMGEAVRNARRELLADSKLAGLQLVLHGDAAWSVGGQRR